MTFELFWHVMIGIVVGLGVIWLGYLAAEVDRLRKWIIKVEAEGTKDHSTAESRHVVYESRMAKFDGKFAGHDVSLTNLGKRLAALESWRAG